jgi:hypothetical protein
VNADTIRQRIHETQRELIDATRTGDRQHLFGVAAHSLIAMIGELAAQFAEIKEVLMSQTTIQADASTIAALQMRVGGVLCCTICQKVISIASIPSVEFTAYIADGFPRCCDLEMLWITAAEMADPRSRWHRKEATQ